MDATAEQPIPFTQFMRPTGRPMPVSIKRPDDIATKASAIIDAGYRFECEMLTTGDVSLTVTDDHGDLEIEVVPNGTDVPAAVDRLVERAFKSARALDVQADPNWERCRAATDSSVEVSEAFDLLNKITAAYRS